MSSDERLGPLALFPRVTFSQASKDTGGFACQGGYSVVPSDNRILRQEPEGESRIISLGSRHSILFIDRISAQTRKGDGLSRGNRLFYRRPPLPRPKLTHALEDGLATHPMFTFSMVIYASNSWENFL